jgi:Tol biopolymer transport system component/tRNA A-37 threonylcarbamoyl transferase component Bud32
MSLDQLAAALADRYRLERQLGQGGMATVYLAEDLRHHRQVALKVLRPELAAVIGAERFLQEIRLTANLQHPHILPLFDSGEVEGTVFYIMPFIEGESLRDRLTREKQLPVADALRIATQVAQALDYAHRHGVIHRDIKPENILLHDESAQVADFGIALAASKAGGTRLTETGMSLGTPHYMSPEQAMGERVLDARSDVYALGATLYEMLTGEPPFTGPTAQAIVARVLSEQPRPVSGLRPMVPRQVEEAVRTALQKLPADRFATAASFADALAREDAPSGPARRADARAPLLRWAPWLVTAALAVALVIAHRGRRDTPLQPPSRLAVLAPGLGGSGGTALTRQVALSPDGGTVIYASVDESGSNHLVRQSLDAEVPTALTLEGETQSLGNPVISPDGRWVLASTVLTGHLYRFPLVGGTGRRLGSGRQVYSRLNGYFAFTPTGEVWATGLGSTSDIMRVDAGDTVVQTLGPYQSGVRVEQVLADGSVLVTLRAMGSTTGSVSVLDPETAAENSVLATPVVEARYSAGYLVFALGSGDLQAVAFDPRRHAVTGTPVTIASGVSLTGTGIAQFAVAPNGTVAYIPEEPRSLVFVDRTGRAREATTARRSFHAPLFSPDGLRLTTDFTTAEGRDVWLLSTTSGTLTRTTFDRDGHDATWTPDGRFLTYTSGKSGVLGLYRTRPGSAEPAESLLSTPLLGWTGQWLTDGTALVTVGNVMRQNSQSDIGIIRNAGHGPLEPLVASSFNEQYPNVSHDQRWLAFTSDQSGQLEVYVRPLDGEGDVVQVSQNGGNEPVWARNGRELFYRGFSAEGHPMLFAASVGAGPGFTVADRQPLFSLADYVGTQPHANYDVSPDGRTFVMVRRSPSTRVMIIQNLPALVEHRRGEGR